MAITTVLRGGSISVIDYRCSVAPEDEPFVEQHGGFSLSYVRDGSFAEDASRIRCNPGIFARLRSFAANVLRFNGAHNVTDARHRIAFGGMAGKGRGRALGLPSVGDCVPLVTCPIAAPSASTG